jgi:hypothetical protein
MITGLQLVEILIGFPMLFWVCAGITNANSMFYSKHNYKILQRSRS